MASVNFMISTALSILTLSSPQVIWLEINQFQLLILLPLTGAFMPEEVRDYLLSFFLYSFNFNLNFLFSDQKDSYNAFLESFGFDHPNKQLEIVGLQYTSTLLNCFMLLLTLGVLLLIHGVVLLMYKFAHQPKLQK